MMGKITSSDNSFISYKFRPGRRGPTVIYLGGYHSNMEGEKALGIDKWAAKNSIKYLRFDYFGHGTSSGNFAEGTITRWLNDTLRIIDNATKGKLILVGSSMGGWISFLATLKRRERVDGIVCIAPALDFTEDLIWKKIPTSKKKSLLKKGCYYENFKSNESYPITMKLIKDGRKHLLLRKKINIKCPIRIIHGIKDAIVPWQINYKIEKKVSTKNLTITLIKNGDHSLSKNSDIKAITYTVGSLI